jgi:hypothetical protein
MIDRCILKDTNILEFFPMYLDVYSIYLNVFECIYSVFECIDSIFEYIYIWMCLYYVSMPHLNNSGLFQV